MIGSHAGWRTFSSRLAWLALLLGIHGNSKITHAATTEPPHTPAAVAAIRAEALRANHDPEGRPLPLAAHWHRATCPLEWQIEMIRQGHKMLPWIEYGKGGESGAEKLARDHGAALRQLAAWHLPLALITGGQWEADFYQNRRWRALPAGQTGAGVSTSGKRLPCVSPFSPVAPWEKLGREWTDNANARKLQELYPDPPRVFFVSNNEAGTLRWENVEKEKNYLEKYGAGREDEFKRRVLGDGWIERYRALLKGMREGLAEEAWRRNARFIAYDAFGPSHFGRPGFSAQEGGWKKYSTTTADRIAWEWHAWQGAVPSYYDNHWQPQKSVYNVWSCQVETMNWVFMKEEAFKANPDYWFELIFWDGNLPGKENDRYKTYSAAGQPPSPARYRGWVQYGMWLLTPRVAREWRSSADPRERWWDYFKEIVAAVDRVHADPVLARFWRRGELVPNRAHPHPFSTDIPERWKDVDRWYQLDTSLDPPRPWELTTRLPVFALARVTGKMPRREWLLYAHAPLGDRKAVRITLPEFGPVTVDVALGGSFYVVREADKSVAALDN